MLIVRHAFVSLSMTAAVLVCAGEAPDKAPPIQPQPATPNVAPQPNSQGGPQPAAPVVRAPRVRPGPVGAPPGINAAPAETPADIKDFSNSRYCMDLAQVHLRYNAIERAEEMLGKAIAASKDKNEKVQANMLLANLLTRKQDWNGAAKCYETILAEADNPSQKSQCMNSLADIYNRQGNPEKAEKLLMDVASAPTQPENDWQRKMAWQQLLGMWRTQDGKIDKVAAELEAKLTEDPKNISVMERLSDIYTSYKRDPVKAAAILEKLTEAKPDDKYLVSRLATSYQEQKQYDKAIAILQKLTADKTGAGRSASFQIAQIMLQSGKKDEAVKWAAEHLGGDGTPGSETMLQVFYEQAGMLAESEDLLLKMAEKAQNPQQKAQHLIRSADLARQRKDFAKSEERLRAVMKDYKDDKMITGQAKSALIRLYEQQGKINELKLDN